ncbi:30S ribosomal protein S8 [Candidatus Aerophobetes bacterium]|nr:30S ribosomal protein S8 [Candidatus Aerophobetes bacterium]
MHTDPIADLLTRIRNANMLSQPSVEVLTSKLKENIVSVLEEEGYIKGYKVKFRGNRKVLEIFLKYSEDGERVITHLEKVSKPGRRRYVKKDEIPRVLNGLGICILSTSRGVFSGEKAKNLGIGGEILCYIW